MSEQSREPGKVAGASAGAGAPPDGGAPPDEAGQAPAAGEPAAGEPAALVPEARKPASEEERAELERLRAEVRELREQGNGGGSGQQEAGAPEKRRRGRWRTAVAVVLITCGCVLAPEAVLGVWAANQVSNTDRYVANVAPLIKEPAIQSALSNKITAEITSRIDVPSLTASASAELARANLPRLSALLANFQGPIANGVDSLISTTASKAVASPAMETLWVSANRIAHQGLVRVLSGQGNGSLSVVNGQVVLSLGPLITQVKENLTARGFGFANKIPVVNATFPLFEARNLAKAQREYRLITTLRWVLPLLSLALLAAGVWIARRHRRALIGAALGLSASMLVLAAGLLTARAIYLDSVPQSVLPADAAAALFDTLVRFIRDGLRVLLLIGLVVAGGAFLVGPSAAAVRTRHAAGSGIDWVRNRGERAGVHAGPVGTWVGGHKTLLRATAVGVAVLVFVFWGQPTLAVVIWLVVLLLVVLGLIELLGGGQPRRAPASGGSAPV